MRTFGATLSLIVGLMGLAIPEQSCSHPSMFAPVVSKVVTKQIGKFRISISKTRVRVDFRDLPVFEVNDLEKIAVNNLREAVRIINRYEKPIRAVEVLLEIYAFSPYPEYTIDASQLKAMIDGGRYVNGEETYGLDTLIYGLFDHNSFHRKRTGSILKLFNRLHSIDGIESMMLTMTDQNIPYPNAIALQTKSSVQDYLLVFVDEAISVGLSDLDNWYQHGQNLGIPNDHIVAITDYALPSVKKKFLNSGVMLIDGGVSEKVRSLRRLVLE